MKNIMLGITAGLSMNSKRRIKKYFQSAKAHVKVNKDPHPRGCDLILGLWPRLMGFPVSFDTVPDADTLSGTSMQTHAQGARVST